MKKRFSIALAIIGFLTISLISSAKDYIQPGDTKKDVLEVLGAPVGVSRYEALDKEIWEYGLLSSITFKAGRVYEYRGGQNLKIAINPNGKYLDIVDSDRIVDEYYSYGGKRHSIQQEENYYGTLVNIDKSTPVYTITPQRISEYKHYKVVDYYGNYHSFVAENGTYYGQISELTGRPKTVYVRGYFRKDGTYVRSHYRSKPRR